MVVFGLATSHDSEVVSKQMQVRPGDQPGYPKDTIESFVGHSSMGLLCPLLSKKFYIFSDGSHTHTPCQSRVSCLEEYSGLTCRCTNCCEPSKL